jgi:hypothetical protein
VSTQTQLPPSTPPVAPPDPMAHLANRAILTPQPFTSGAPIVGGFIAWFRSAWNSISTRWYLAPILQQQNELNLMLIDELRSLRRDMAEQQARWPIVEEISDRLIATDRDATTLAHDLAQLTAAVIQLEDRLATLATSRIDAQAKDAARRD